jgi:TolB-like protein/predicted DNA-binding transcriptional regulator AlpA
MFETNSFLYKIMGRLLQRVEMRDKEILHSWKEISEYLGRDRKTCFRWEKELGLPIHRIDEDSLRSKVFAYKSEIDKWLNEKANHIELKKRPFMEKKWVIPGLVSATALLLIVSAVLYFSYRKYSSSYPADLAIAVFPFENSNFSEHEQYLPVGIRKFISSSLSRTDNLRVIPSKVLYRNNDSYKELKNISEELKITYFLKVQLEKNENKLRICAQLVNPENNKIIWNMESVDRLENIFSILEDICQGIHTRLNPGFNTDSIPSFNDKLTQDFAALDSYLKANYILNSSKLEDDDPVKLYNRGKYYQGKWTAESNALAINLFSQAIEIDENFAQAYIGLARCYANYVNFNWDYKEEWLSKAEELLAKAATINPEGPEYYSTLIQVYLIKYFAFNENTKDKAFDLAQEAIQKYPFHSNLYAQVGYCYYLNFGESGNESDFNKAMELNMENYLLHPTHINNIIFAELLMLNQEYESALAVCSGIQGGDSSLMANFRKGEIYYYMGDLDSSEAVFLQSQSVDDIDFQIGSLFYLGMISAQRGDKSEVERLLKKIEVIAPKEFDFFDDKLKLASIYMGIGKKELGYKFLEDFFAEEKRNKTRYTYHKYIDIDRNFDSIREEEKFRSLIQKREN